ncbi:MAG: 4-hydroxythreonine-4-phosphate dehydrogenase PdxA [Gemmatimonadetes bacterium]|nr:4-hydroxythreonine-4-phosphate dehydrogenase PdxA [Gemmatimonadota bacterium]
MSGAYDAPGAAGAARRPVPARVRLAVTLGDPRGIGPEVAAAAAQSLSRDDSRPVLLFVGPEGTGAEAAADEFIAVGQWSGGGDAVIAGRLAGAAIRTACRLALDGAVDALVTAPVDKAALHAAGFEYPGHTEMLAEWAGTQAVAMMMVAESTRLGGPLRVVLATRHLPLAQVPAALSAARIIEQTRLAAAGLRSGWGIPDPRIALCAVNPHASDGGLFGDEEARILEPARRALLAEGVAATGPIAADTVFVRALGGEFDAVVAPYHDVGMAAFKTAAFGQGVNVTLGLPFPRTSPDHGTAMDIAGRAAADPSSMREALGLAQRLTRAYRATSRLVS